ncbi:acriflavine resistance protein B, partial [Escherichia coli 96.0932]
IDTTCNH